VKQNQPFQRPGNVPSSGRGASSALEALIRKRIPAPASHARLKPPGPTS
jgi:hypothetical protein